MGLGLLLGTVAAWWRDSWASGVLTNVSIGVSQVPPYLVALVLVLVIAYNLKILPPKGAWDAQYAPGFNLPFIGSVIQHAILPALSLVMVSVAGWILSTRSLIVSILGE